MRRIAPTEFTLPKYDKLMKEINDFSIAVKLHHTIDASKEDAEKLAKAKESVLQPTWQNVTELLNKIYRELEQDRYNPIKY